MSSRVHIQNTVTNERSAINSFLPRSIMTFSKVRPWLLCIVIAYTSQTGICNCKQTLDLLSYIWQISIIGMIFLPSKLVMIGPL